MSTPHHEVLKPWIAVASGTPLPLPEIRKCGRWVAAIASGLHWHHACALTVRAPESTSSCWPDRWHWGPVASAGEPHIDCRNIVTGNASPGRERRHGECNSCDMAITTIDPAAA